MTQYRIIKTAQKVFSLRWVGNDPLIMNFNPIIQKYDLSGDFVLLHWQAKPKNLRGWGLYDSATDQYYQTNSDLQLPELKIKLVDVNERYVLTVPTAMILFQDCRYNKLINAVEKNAKFSNSNINSNGGNSTNSQPVEGIPTNKPSTKKT